MLVSEQQTLVGAVDESDIPFDSTSVTAKDDWFAFFKFRLNDHLIAFSASESTESQVLPDKCDTPDNQCDGIPFRRILIGNVAPKAGEDDCCEWPTEHEHVNHVLPKHPRN